MLCRTGSSRAHLRELLLLSFLPILLRLSTILRSFLASAQMDSASVPLTSMSCRSCFRELLALLDISSLRMS
jgi:hypothetical protein